LNLMGCFKLQIPKLFPLKWLQVGDAKDTRATG